MSATWSEATEQRIYYLYPNFFCGYNSEKYLEKWHNILMNIKE